MLTNVTLTGADDSVDPGELIALSRDFPLAEWGILVGSRGGVARFPSGDWIVRLMEAVAEAHPLRVWLALHVCGKVLREVLNAGTFPGGAALCMSAFRRMQLNFHGEPIAETDLGREKAVHNIIAVQAVTRVQEIIVQLDGANDWILDALLCHGIRASGLYDRSHGAGVKPDQWPFANRAWSVGYAGGLGPENVQAELGEIAAASWGQSVWIDMESKLRGADGKFDLGRCRRVLEQSSRGKDGIWETQQGSVSSRS